MDEKLFDLMTKMYAEMQEMKSSMNERFSAIDERFDTIEKKLDNTATKQDLAHLEHKLLDKVNALFDARQMQIDHETAMAKDIKQVQGTVEKIELKIIRNS